MPRFYGSTRIRDQLQRLKTTLQTMKQDIGDDFDDSYKSITASHFDTDFQEVFGQTGGLGTKTITENGTYDSLDDNLAGYSAVTVNVTSGIPVVQKSAWDALTTEQKRAYGYVAIQDSLSGFQRGILAYGGDYVPIGMYLPYSTTNNIITEAYPSLYTAGDTQWGLGNNKVNFINGTPTLVSDDYLSVPTKTDGVIGYVDLLETDKPMTAYVVVKTINPTQYSRIVCCLAQRQNYCGAIVRGNNVYVGTWIDEKATGMTSYEQFNVYAIRFSNDPKSFYAAAYNGDTYDSYKPSIAYYSGSRITLGRSDTDSSTVNAEPCDLQVKYVGVVNTNETDEVVENNVRYLYSIFGGE